MGLIEGNPTAVQLAGDDWWESALVRTVGQSRWSAEEVRALARSYEDLAVEVFIRNMDGREGFIGVRYAGLTVEPVVERVLGLAGSVLAGELSGVDDVVQVLRFHGRELSAGAPAGIELGVVNAWRSVGSLVFWRAGKPPPDEQEARRALERHPRLLEPQTNPVALEFAFEGALPHWVGVEVSNPTKTGQVLDVSLLLRAIDGVLGTRTNGGPSSLSDHCSS